MTTATGSTVQAAPAPAGTDPRAYSMLALATIGFALNFWAWALLSPLAIRLKGELGLTSFQQALLVAVPVIVGSVGRIPVGALTDRYGGRTMLPAVSLVTIVPVLFLGLAGHSSYAGVLIGGFFLGIGGTAFAVGVPFVNNWFPPHRRGFAIGVFGAGMGGTAISALTTVKLAKAHGIASPFVLTAVVLAVYGVLAALLLRDPPFRVIHREPVLARLTRTLRLRVTWQTSALYAVGFGGYVAFSVYLPTYLKTAYGLTQADAANKMAGFVLVAVVMRPVGGWLCDRIAPTSVLGTVFAVVAVCALLQSFEPALRPGATAAFLIMAGGLGVASGAVFALVARLAPAGQVGSVTGVVGAAGGLGGFVPPLVMGAVYGATGSYAVGLVLLAITAAAAAAFTLTAVRGSTTERPDMENLIETADRLLGEAAASTAGRASHTVVGGSGHALRQTVIALRAGQELAEHASPGEATLQVLRGTVALQAGTDVVALTEGELAPIPAAAHSLSAKDDSAVLLTVVKPR